MRFLKTRIKNQLESKCKQKQPQMGLWNPNKTKCTNGSLEVEARILIRAAIISRLVNQKPVLKTSSEYKTSISRLENQLLGFWKPVFCNKKPSLAWPWTWGLLSGSCSSVQGGASWLHSANMRGGGK